HVDFCYHADRFDLLAGDHFYERRLVRAAKCHGYYCANAGRSVSSRSDLPDPGTGYAIRRGDPDFSEAHVQRLSPSRALARRAIITARGVFVRAPSWSRGRTSHAESATKPDRRIALKSYCL